MRDHGGEPTDVDVSQLWFDRGRLVKGARPESAVPYADHDYMVIEIERRETRRERPDLRMDFEAAIERLPDGAREVFVLYDVEGYKHEEIAELLGIAVGTSKSQLHRARMALRESLR